MSAEDPLQTRYEVLAKIGEGGMGVVYRGRDVEADTPVAIKLLPRHLWSDREARGRFLLEAILSSTLHHPNIARFLDSGESESRGLYLVLEFCPGETLQRRMLSDLPRLPEALDAAIQTAEGLAAAHEKGIVHRDIKPSNLMLTASWKLKILDFGLARLEASDGLTRPGQVVGSTSYASPEQLTGGQVDARTDLWSLGAVLFEMIAGRVPFPGTDLAAARRAVLEARPEPLRSYRPDIPAELQEVIDRLLVKDPAQREPSAAELARLLRRIRLRLDSSAAAPPPALAPPSRHQPAVWRRLLRLLGGR